MPGIGETAEGAALASLILVSATIVAAVAYYSAKRGFRIVLKRSALTIIGLVITYASVHYFQMARWRAGIAEEQCKKSTAPDGRYVVRVCSAGDAKVLRLWSADESTLLAERTFPRSSEPVPVWWEANRVLFDDQDPDVMGTIKLPPTLKDRLLAYLP
ncbi:MULTISPECIES: hypothetical protein [unclassified Caballeronia]|uniref:hypothetical protein n=1 Tax=unclassified Caballeronia TaxID=2646786 RepID=UPI00285A4E6A|nr:MULTISPECIES: hypothetical protein [unclassified Caballeronia]MDR5740578.1 hypothetical protein [Caballeronia sp. LZ016]MDR5808900.1 hypothetical protein [Caballeronia sp. LZ019]